MPILGESESQEQLLILLSIGLGFGPNDLAAVRVGQNDQQTYDLRRGKTGIERFGHAPPLIWNGIENEAKVASGRRPRDVGRFDPVIVAGPPRPLGLVRDRASQIGTTRRQLRLEWTLPLVGVLTTLREAVSL